MRRPASDYLLSPTPLADRLRCRVPQIGSDCGLHDLAGLLPRLDAVSSALIQSALVKLGCAWRPAEQFSTNSTADNIYRDIPPSRAANTLVGEAVAAAVSRLPQQRVLRILEIGAGTGGMTASVLPHLSADRTEYVFTDVSPLLVRQSQGQLGRFPFVRFQVLDIEENPRWQGFAAGRFDVVIAANVLHATADLQQTLSHVRTLLALGGLLVLLEVTAPRRWIDLTFGLTDGWWKLSDSHLRPHYPLMAPDAWCRLLEQVGFSSAADVPVQAGDHGALFEQAVILARAPAEVAQQQKTRSDNAVLPPPLGREANADIPSPFGRGAGAEGRKPGRWLVLADQRGVGRSLAALLERRGESCLLVSPGEHCDLATENHFRIRLDRAEDYRQLLDRFRALNPLPCRAVVHLGSLDAEMPVTNKASSEAPDGAPGEAAHLDAAHLDTAQTRSCGSTLLLLQAVLKAERKPTQGMWLVTRSAQAVTPACGELQMMQTPLLGFGRGLALEHPELWGGLIDLGPVACRSRGRRPRKSARSPSRSSSSGGAGLRRGVGRVALCRACQAFNDRRIR